jgi:ABC-2 type transport system permease protein
MNTVIASMTLRSMLGKRRAWLFLVLPLILLGLALLFRLTVGEADRESVAVGLLGGFAVGTLVPLLALIAGTGSIGPEIDDGSIVYLLAKPIDRRSVVLSKVLVAVGVTSLFGAVPVLLSGWLLVGGDELAVAYFLAALVGGIAYVALFVLLAVVSRNSVVIGLVYAIVWESLIGSFVPGAQALSIQQWSLSLARAVVGKVRANQIDLTAAVRPEIALPLLAVVAVASTYYAGVRLRSLRIAGED